MSLFDLFRRDKSPDEKPAQSAPPTSPSRGTPSAPPPVARPSAPLPVAPTYAAPPAASQPPVDLDRIRGELMEIAKIVGQDDATGTRSGDEVGTRVDLPLMEVIKLAPHAFRSVSSVPSDTRITVYIPDLFDQLTKGKVTTTLSTLIAAVPQDNRSAAATMHGDELISIPLPLVVSAVNPNELQKRTAKQEVDRGEKLLPNLFTPGSLKKPAAPSSPGTAPAATPVAPQTPAAPATIKPHLGGTLPSAPAPVMPLIPVPPPPVAAPAVVPPSPPPPASVTPTVQLPLAPVPPPPAAIPVVAPPPPPRPIAPPPPAPAAVVPPTPPPPQVVAPPPPEAVAEVPPIATSAVPVLSTPAPAVNVPVEPRKLEPEVQAAAPTPEPKPAPVPETMVPAAPSRAEMEAKEGREQKAALEAAIEDAASRENSLTLYGLDINSASAEEMVDRFNGVGRKLAEKIVANRIEFGLFKDVYDLARVPGVKGKVFQRITGMAWPAQLFRHREQVSKLIGVTGREIPDVRGVAQRFKELEGFNGCIIIDQDGLVLASTWEHASSDALGAFAPQMFKKLSRYVKQLKLGNIKTMTFFAEEHPITLVTSGAILFVALHKASRFSKRQVELIQALATELGRKLARL